MRAGLPRIKLKSKFISYNKDYLNPCSTIDCLNGGDCLTDPFGQFKCVCSSGFNGTYCGNKQSKTFISL